MGCGKTFVRGARHKDQAYCGKEECRRKRRARWQKQKMISDPDYRYNHKKSQEKWMKEHPEYWKEYRQRNPEKAQRNQMMQMVRNRKLRKKEKDGSAVIAKMDSSKLKRIKDFGTYYLVPLIAKMDSLKVNIYGIPAP